MFSKKIEQEPSNNSTNLRDKKLAIVGIVRNVGKNFEQDYKRLKIATRMFKERKWIIIESDSTDNTLEILQKITALDKEFTFISLGNIENRYITRSERLAYARNAYIDFLKKKENKRFNYVLVSDFDGLNNLVNEAAIESCWNFEDWAVLTANQNGPYYDIWALRHPLWSPNDCWEELNFYKEYGVNPELALYKSLHSRMLKIPRNSPLLEVDSAFGGMAMYKYRYLIRARYSGVDIKGKPICEHVPLHLKIRENGGHIYINPNLINTDFTDHSFHLKLSSRVKRITKNLILLTFRRKRFIKLP